MNAILWILSAALANPVVTDDIVVALQDQLESNKSELSLPDAPPIYHLRYHYYDMKQYDAKATMGALLEESTDPYQYLGVEVRVGSPQFDNTGFGGWENGFTGAWLPEGLTPQAAVLAAWRETDRAYKQAVEHFSRKKAQFRPPPNYPGDYTMTAPNPVDLGAGRQSDDATLKDLAKSLSNVLKGDPRIVRGEAYIGQESGAHWVIDSEGFVSRLPVNESTIRLVLHVRTDDGLLLTDQRMWSTRSSDELPPKSTLVADAQKMRDDLLQLANEKALEQEYVGPILFQDQAAIDLFRYLLVPQLEGTPPEIPFESFLGDIGSSGSGGVRLGRRVLPMGWTVTDDPTSNPAHPSSFQVDAESSPTEPVQAVQDGILRLAMMSRVPRKDIKQTNGHARGIDRARLSGRVAQLSIEAPKISRSKTIHKRARRIADSYGHSGYYIVRRLQESSVRAIGSMPSFSAGEDGTVNLPLPVSIFWVDSDGAETEVRGARLTGVQRWVLRDIAATGPTVSGTFMIPSSPGDGLYTPTQGLPTWMSAPEILIGEMEIVPTPGDPKSKPTLPHPLQTTKTP